MTRAGQPPLASSEPVRAGARGFLAEMRRLEREALLKPRWGRNERLVDAIADLGQDPFLGLAASDLAEPRPKGARPSVRPRAFGYFGPFGPLPLSTTEEALRWAGRGNHAFVAFADLLADRFVQLHYRAWSEARPIAQFDRPDEDGFQNRLHALIGQMTPAFRDGDAADEVRLAMVGLACHRITSATRLRQMLTLGVGADVEVEEMVATWLELEPDDRSRLGSSVCTLGGDLRLGHRVRTLDACIRLHVRTPSLAAFRSFLPGGDGHLRLRGLVAWRLGVSLDIQVALWLPAAEVPRARLGADAELGWMAAVAPREAGAVSGWVRTASFDLGHPGAGRVAA